MTRFNRRTTGLMACAGLALLGLAACAPTERPPAPALPEGMTLTAVDYGALPGWHHDRVSEALPALRRSCDRLGALAERRGEDAWLGPGSFGGTYGDWVALCAELARAVPPAEDADEIALRAFLETRLQPYAVTYADGGATRSDGLFTGYYEAELRGARDPSPEFPVPVHAVPPDLLTVDLAESNPDVGKSVPLVGRRDGDRVLPYWTRAEIDDGALADAPVLLWAADAVDVHVLHIQGSGRVLMPDGSVERIGYAGNNGHPFVGLGRIMLDRGVVEPGKGSMPHIRAWLKANPEAAHDIMRQNPRYIFFRSIPGGEGPIGALGVPLTPKRSVAVDTRYVPLTVPLWLDTVDPDNRPLRRLVVAQDVGSAIKGVVRGDFFWGSGEAALADAGRMKSRGTWYLLLPRSRAPQV
ncbi:murein transglycosylase A [Novispirillum sp. DQ9]|uniref:murein transglycosylase A n=1 Tax=Novispirillum sp. DQ9 TaxID=3398612 RepID=UPI003C7DE990